MNIKKYRPKAIYVTDFSSLMWCEKQFEFGLEHGKKETEAMKKGSEHHEELHEEVTEILKVSPKTKEDFFALKMYNCIQALEGIDYENIAREIPIMGFIEGLFITGYIDEVVIKNNVLMLIDTKTRSKKSMPSVEQKRTSHIQLMCYKFMLDNFIDKKYELDSFFKVYGFDENSKISDEFKKQFKELKQDVEPNLKKLATKAFNLLSGLPTISDNLTIRYVYQLTGEFISADIFNYNKDWLLDTIQVFKEFLQNKRSAKLVPEEETWKCKFCDYYEMCKGKSETV
ncbi:PD-(D/E)XK nuclease family protein [Nanoarchaeota archaeon]